MQAKAPGTASDFFFQQPSCPLLVPMRCQRLAPAFRADALPASTERLALAFRVPASFAPAPRNSMPRASRARLALFAYPFRPFSRRRKEGPTPVHQLPRRRRIWRGDHSPLPREAALGEFAGHAIVEAVVRNLTDGDQIPAAPLPAWEVLNRIHVVHSGRQLVAAVPTGLAAFVLIAPEYCIPKMQPAPAFVIHRQKEKAP